LISKGIHAPHRTRRLPTVFWSCFLVASTPTRVPTWSGTSLPSGGRTATYACTTACSAMRLTTHPDRVEGGMHTTRRERNCNVTHCGRTHG